MLERQHQLSVERQPRSTETHTSYQTCSTETLDTTTNITCGGVMSTNEDLQAQQELMDACRQFANVAFRKSEYLSTLRPLNPENSIAWAMSHGDRGGYVEFAARAVCSVFRGPSLDKSSLPEKWEAYDRATRKLTEGVTLISTSRRQLPPIHYISLVGAAIFLAIFEMRMETDEIWLTHLDAVRRIMEILGAPPLIVPPLRTYFLSFRGFLIAAAIDKGEHCFLATDEWPSLALEIRAKTQTGGRTQTLARNADMIFLELVKLPGLVVEAQRGFPQLNKARSLLDPCQLKCTIFNLERLSDRMKHWMKFRRSTETEVEIANHLMDGIDMGIHVLGALSDKRFKSGVRTPFRVVSGLSRFVSNGDIATNASLLDNIACTLGMYGTAMLDE
ncbi:hypothetical protein BDV25DRAFT_156138 [Aspergillus avenaceus]|uniref:Transcription factor domain-containing protein n=1 Tax=Aspergillus avenaceus TaxID=36643 RepID=A0A5N6TTT5_ASPAV|nr:hypothetical protein BDV25DRAFT_156138 [Aspergillus avenaceus]